jgi:hypothetical protein
MSPRAAVASISKNLTCVLSIVSPSLVTVLNSPTTLSIFERSILIISANYHHARTNTVRRNICMAVINRNGFEVMTSRKKGNSRRLILIKRYDEIKDWFKKKMIKVKVAKFLRRLQEKLSL